MNPLCKGWLTWRQSDGFSPLKQPLSLQILLTLGLVWTNGRGVWYLKEAMCTSSKWAKHETLHPAPSLPPLLCSAVPLHTSIFLSFLLLRLHGSLLLMSLVSTCHYSPTHASPLPILPHPPCPHCHAVFQINVEILTSDGPRRHRSSKEPTAGCQLSVATQQISTSKVHQLGHCHCFREGRVRGTLTHKQTNYIRKWVG